MDDMMNPGSKERDFSQVQVISRAVLILRALKESGGLKLSQLARRVGLARSTVHRIVATLENEGLVTTQTPDGSVRLGYEVLSLSAGVSRDLRHALHGYMEALATRLDETVDLSIYDRGRMIFLDQVARMHRLRAVSGVGLVFPLHATANGKALLALLTNAEIEKILPRQLEVFTPATLATRRQLIEEIERVRAEGLAYDREEYTPGICAVGATVQVGAMGSAALSVPVPSVRFYGNEQNLADALLETCALINAHFVV